MSHAQHIASTARETRTRTVGLRHPVSGRASSDLLLRHGRRY